LFADKNEETNPLSRNSLAEVFKLSASQMENSVSEMLSKLSNLVDEVTQNTLD